MMFRQPRNLDRPIVVSARFYTPKQKSHFQLYRINPDGSGKQTLTHTDAEDYTPRWSRDGNHILFVRSFERLNPVRLELHQITLDGAQDKKLWETTSEYKPSFYFDEDDVILTIGRKKYVIQASTGRQIALTERPAGLLSPSGKYRALDNRILHETNKTVLLPPELEAMGWLDNATLLCATRERPENHFQRPPLLHLLETTGRLRRSFRVIYEQGAEALVRRDGPGRWRKALPVPWNHDQALLGCERGDTLAGMWQESLLLDLTSGKAAPFTQHGRLALAPNGYEYVTTYNRTRRAYQGRQITLQALYAGDRRKPTAQRSLLGSEVEVNGADWYGGSELRLAG
ncbi:TolB family protein [Armatimonas sp.]|uniref:TolB family protein n=1 Tax=Armatimonas sp. TaxID=1872638 RepID=UPI00374DF0AA